jgi:hypothetical protein
MSELMDLKNGIKINSMYTKKINGIKLYIYIGICNDILTKWVTQSKWDFKLHIQMNEARNGIDYIDSKNQEVIIYEKDEEGFELF